MDCQVVHGVPSNLLGPVDPSCRALSGRLKFTVRHHTFNKYFLFFFFRAGLVFKSRACTWGQILAVDFSNVPNSVGSVLRTCPTECIH